MENEQSIQFPEYGRLDHETDYQGYVVAAEEYLKNAGVVKPEKENALYSLAVCMLAQHWYDNRGVITTGNTSNLPYAVNAIVLQLRSGYS